MKAPRGFLARVAGATITSIIVGALGCEQVLGLDGPYAPGAGAPCIDGTKEGCYTGDPATDGVGICQAGTRTCADGTWGACEGDILPEFERCGGSDDDCDGVAACTGPLEWATSFGGPYTDTAFAIATDPSSNVLVAGQFSATVDFGGGPLVSAGGPDVFVVKLDSAGKHSWSKRFGATGTDGARAIAVDSSGNVIVVGGFGDTVDFGGGPFTAVNSSSFVLKLDPNGNYIWSKAFVGAMSFASTDAAVDPAGNVLISTTIQGTVDFGGGPLTATGESLAVVKLDASGNHVWSKVYGGAMCCGAIRSAIAADSAGNVGVAGSFEGSIDFGGGVATAGNQDIFVAKFSPSGDYLWALQGAGSNNDSVEGLAIDSTGAMIVSGNLDSIVLSIGTGMVTKTSNIDAYLLKVDTNGVFAWAKAFGNGGNVENGSEVGVDSVDNIIVAGNTNDGMLDLGFGPIGVAGLYVVKLDPTGKPIWARHSDIATTPYPDAVLAVDKQGSTLLSRSFVAPFSFGGMTLSNGGGADVFVVKLGL